MSEPKGDLWELPLHETKLCFVDLEMTGLEPKRDRVVQICAELVRGGQTQRRLCSYVKPAEMQTVGNEHLHGISMRTLEDAPAFGQLAVELAQVLDSSILVAHASKHDVGFLLAEFARLGVTLPQQDSWSQKHYLDTLPLARRALQAPSHRLPMLAKHLGIPNLKPHDAGNDVTVTRALFEIICTRLEPKTAGDLWRIARKKRHVKPAILAAVEQALALQQPAEVCYRPSGKAAKNLQFQVTQILSDLDPPVVLGYLHPSRGRRELRADRILSFDLIDHDSP